MHEPYESKSGKFINQTLKSTVAVKLDIRFHIVSLKRFEDTDTHDLEYDNTDRNKLSEYILTSSLLLPALIKQAQKYQRKL